jgi:hypothetical protein
MQKNKEIHIAYIGRLEKEKGIEVVINCIKRAIVEKRKIIWHICGKWAYLEDLQNIKHSHLKVYGHLDKKSLDAILEKTDLVLMPSLFLETFGLVALETLSRGVPVCWFAQGWLRDFIHPSLALDPLDSVNSFFGILDTWIFPVIDISVFSYDLWISRLKELTSWVTKILLVNDYLDMIGWAEQYFHELAHALRSIGKTVTVSGYPWKTNKYLRIYLMLLSPFAFWRGNSISRDIRRFNPDLIWMHSVLRYIWPHGVRVISESKQTKYIIHHDLGLITPRPSQIYSETEIPGSPSLGDWIPHKISILAIIATSIKWLYVRLIWTFLQKNTITHILPSNWMAPYFQKYTDSVPIIFPHTTIIDHSVKL